MQAPSGGISKKRTNRNAKDYHRCMHKSLLLAEGPLEKESGSIAGRPLSKKEISVGEISLRIFLLKAPWVPLLLIDEPGLMSTAGSSGTWELQVPLVGGYQILLGKQPGGGMALWLVAFFYMMSITEWNSPAAVNDQMSVKDGLYARGFRNPAASNYAPSLPDRSGAPGLSLQTPGWPSVLTNTFPLANVRDPFLPPNPGSTASAAALG